MGLNQIESGIQISSKYLKYATNLQENLEPKS